MKTALLILCVWLLLNALFVLVMARRANIRGR